MTSKSPHRYSPELRERAVRIVLEQRGEYKSEWETICSIAPKVGCCPDSLVPSCVSMSGIVARVMADSLPMNVNG